MAGLFRSRDQPPVHPSSQVPECMIKEGVSPTAGRRLNYSERVNYHRSIRLPIQISCVPLLVATVVARVPCELPQAHQLAILTSLLILITFSWKQEHYSDSRPPYRPRRIGLWKYLLLIRKKKNNSHSLVLPFFYGNPVDSRSFTRAF